MSTLPTPPEPQPPRGLRRHLLIAFALVLTGVWMWRAQLELKNEPLVDYSRFYAWVETGKVKSVVLRGSEVEVALKSAQMVQGVATRNVRSVTPATDDSLLPLLHANKVELSVSSEEQSLLMQALVGLVPWVFVIGAVVWFSQRAQKMLSGGPLTNVLKSRGRRFERNDAVSVTFDDVAGLKSAKRDLEEVVQFLKEPDKFRRLGGKVPRGVLLVGPPGTGKTLLARAVAGESKVPFFSISASEFIEMFVGVGAARVRDLFAEAKKDAPAIVFIDEIDAVGRSRGAGLGGGHDEREQTLNQLLSEMDGFDRNDLTIVLAATNRPDVLDPALLRPGRFDRHVIVDRPELGARRAILDVHVKNKPLATDVDLDALARSTPAFSGADLANLVNEAALHATRRSAESIAQADFNAAFDKIVLGDPRETKLLEDERARVAAHEAGHAVVARFSADAEPLERISIIPRGLALGATQQAAGEDRHLLTEPQIQSRLRVAMGGFAAERLLFGSVSSGAENDLKEATKLALNMVAHYGMSRALGPVYYEHETDHAFLGHKLAVEGGISDATVHAIDLEVREVLSHALGSATQLLVEHRRQLDALKAALLQHETLERGEIQAIL